MGGLSLSFLFRGGRFNLKYSDIEVNESEKFIYLTLLLNNNELAGCRLYTRMGEDWDTSLLSCEFGSCIDYLKKSRDASSQSIKSNNTSETIIGNLDPRSGVFCADSIYCISGKNSGYSLEILFCCLLRAVSCFGGGRVNILCNSKISGTILNKIGFLSYGISNDGMDWMYALIDSDNSALIEPYPIGNYGT